MANVSYRKERIDRGIKARTDDIFAIASLQETLYLLFPRLLLIVPLVVFPLLQGIIGAYWETVFLIALVVTLLALSWDLLASVGLVSLGQALFYGVGGYFTAFLSNYLGLPPLISIPLATVSGASVCTLLLYPVLRLRGVYFGLITFAIPLLLMRTIEATKILGGTEGISGLAPLPGLTVELYVMVAIAFVGVFGLRRLIDTDYGLVLRAIRDNDRSVEAGGINVPWYKAQAVFIAALPATFAGAFIAHHYQVVGMSAFALDYSVLPLTAVVIGGPGSFAGALLGAFVLVPLSETLRQFGTLRVVIYSVILLIFVVGLPEGIFRFAQRKYQQFERLVPMEEVAKE
ncbi:MAG: branched-chain amino acid ABC transporter permease [Chloroflexi bacterium]|nr:branched-chain amino acid ABC transporter permease [Chloroflexota bacterium]MDA8187759.1 branched-chain amino acid ABC transporter permease [Dehalococcoidales bacterium]